MIEASQNQSTSQEITISWFPDRGLGDQIQKLVQSDSVKIHLRE